MKVKELMKHAHLFGDQKTTLHDYSTQRTFTTQDRYAFGLDATEVERLLTLKVNTFRTSDKGLEIFAE